MNPRALAKAYYDLHAYKADVEARMQLTTLMHRVAKHRSRCDECVHGTCDITVRQALRVEAQIEAAIIDGALARGRLFPDPWEVERLAAVARNCAIQNKLYPAP